MIKFSKQFKGMFSDRNRLRNLTKLEISRLTIDISKNKLDSGLCFDDKAFIPSFEDYFITQSQSFAVSFLHQSLATETFF